MKKRSYHTTDVKAANWEQIKTQTENRRIVYGVDVAKEAFVGVVMTGDRSVVTTLKWRHPEQTRELVDHVVNDLAAKSLEVVMEPSGT